MRVAFSGLEFDSRSRRLTRRGAIVGLTPKAALLLDALIAAAPEPLSKDALCERLWRDVAVEPGNLHNLISELRSAIGDDDRSIIRTIHRRGYAFAAPLKREMQRGPRLEIGTESIPLARGENIIGRESLGTPDVSREHARIDVDGDRVSIEDLRSKNGTWLNGKRLRERAMLREGDQIVFGRTRAIVRIADAAAPTITARPLTGNRE